MEESVKSGDLEIRAARAAWARDFRIIVTLIVIAIILCVVLCLADVQLHRRVAAVDLRLSIVQRQLDDIGRYLWGVRRPAR